MKFAILGVFFLPFIQSGIFVSVFGEIVHKNGELQLWKVFCIVNRGLSKVFVVMIDLYLPT